MILISKVSMALEANYLAPNGGEHLMWAMVTCPKLFIFILELFGKNRIQDVLAAKLVVHTNAADPCGFVDCTELARLGAAPAADHPDAIFRVPLMRGAGQADAKDYAGNIILAAFLELIITFYWVQKSSRWITDVHMYDSTIPQTVTMC